MQLFIADARGQILAQLTQFKGASLNTLAWSGDDQQIALQVNQQGRNFIALIDLQQLTVEPLIDDDFINAKPAWSVDGDFLFFGSNRGGDWQIWQQHLASGRLVQLTTHGGRIAKPGLDGQTLFPESVTSKLI